MACFVHPKWAKRSLPDCPVTEHGAELMNLSSDTSLHQQKSFLPSLHAAPYTQNYSFYRVPFGRYASTHSGSLTLIAQFVFYTFTHEALITVGCKYIKFKSNAISVKKKIIKQKRNHNLQNPLSFQIWEFYSALNSKHSLQCLKERELFKLKQTPKVMLRLKPSFCPEVTQRALVPVPHRTAWHEKRE